MRGLFILTVSFFLLGIGLMGCHQTHELSSNLDPGESDLVFNDLSKTWDEGVPIGNGLIGGLIWQKGDNLRISLDRSDLWDQRPSKAFSDPDLTYKWLYENKINGTYDEALKKLNSYRPENYAPTKLPGGCLEFDLKSLGNPDQVRLYLENAVCDIKWEKNTEMLVFTHATYPVGWFRIVAPGSSIQPVLKAPEYKSDRNKNEARVAGQGFDLLLLNYEQGEVKNDGNSSSYFQKCWGDFYYNIAVKWVKKGDLTEGVWSITSKFSSKSAMQEVENAIIRGFASDFKSHKDWWKKFWAQSSVSIPDKVLQKQWDNEIYKIGATARANTPPLTLQAVWTADDGRLPPWKGDYHHDLNTELSYWPFYTANKLEYEKGFVDWLWSIADENEKFTKRYFGVEGLNVPGMSTINGSPLFGWIQYGMSPTISGWLTHHFYLHWKYSNDAEFLQNKAYPYLKKVAQFYENLSVTENGKRKFPISSSPEIFNDSKEAWFTEITNYDLAIVRFVYTAATEMATCLNLQSEADHYKKILSEWPEFNLDKENCLTFAPGTPYEQSHRHFSHLMAFHPFGLIDWSKGEKDREIITSTINRLDTVGPDWWCGYSYSWLGNLKARAMDGEGAARALRTFADCFCLRNTFHANGDQTKTGKSNYTYRPFTLEGNFAFASGINEMLIQSHTGTVRIFPAIPKSWDNVSFKNLRTWGAFLVSSDLKDGKVNKVEIESETGGIFKMYNPFSNKEFEFNGPTAIHDSGGIIEFNTTVGQKIVLNAKNN
jgi:alpha-L-fucosidase 2